MKSDINAMHPRIAFDGFKAFWTQTLGGALVLQGAFVGNPMISGVGILSIAFGLMFMHDYRTREV